MALLLENKKSIISVIALKIEFYNYKNSPDDTAHTEVVRVTDATWPVKVKINGTDEEFLPLGSLISFSTTKNELANTQSQVSIVMSGLPEGVMWKTLNNPIKNSRVTMYRVFYDTNTKQLINTNSFGKFNGTVSYYTIEDTLGDSSTFGTCTITFICNNKTTDLAKTIGRTTGPLPMKFFFPDDVSFDRVMQLVGAQYNFGAPSTGTGLTK